MWIGDADVPRELIEAGRAGELVLFVGAGASMDEPSCLPNFGHLTKEVAESAQRQATKADLDRPDLYLGRLEDEGIKVRDLAAALLSPVGSAPNRLHRAIATLASTCPTARVVTTNFDRHLSTALAERQARVLEYRAPALPMGDDFDGLVYLHGSLDQEARQLVLTDKDFGAAYLHDAWAARFLERMFRSRVVLFIGYSHKDVVMQYFARALGRDAARFALTPWPDDPDWRTWGITPVGYQLTGDSHEALPVMLEKWALLASMNLLQHADRVAEIVSAGVPVVPEEVSYLEETFADPTRVKYFTDAAKGVDWLRWALNRPEFAQLSSWGSDERLGRALAHWVAWEFVAKEEYSTGALEIMRQRSWSPTTWRTITHAVCVSSISNHGVPTWLRPWVVLLIERDPGTLHDPGDFLTTLVASLDWTDNPDTALLLFDHLTKPRLVPMPTFVPGQSPQFDVLLRGSEMQLTLSWTLHVKSLAQVRLPEMLAIVDHHLRAAHRMTEAANPGFTFDRLSYKRVAIETINDSARDALDLLIDAARDLLSHALDSQLALAERYLDAWADAAETILVRLALHGWLQRADQSPSRKISWLAGRQWLYRRGIEHEINRLLQAALPGADPESVDLILREALNAPDDAASSTERNERRRFDLVGQLAQAAPSVPRITEAFADLKEKHPGWAPEMTPVGKSGVAQNPFDRVSPFTVDEIHKCLRSDILGIVDRLVASITAEAGPRAEETFRILQQCTVQYPEDGIDLLPVLAERMPLGVPYVIEGWADASINSETAQIVLGELRNLDLKTFGVQISWLLASGVRDGASTEWHTIDAARALAEAVWGALDTPLPYDGDDLFMHALNSAPGRLAEFWIRALSHDWRQAGDKWVGLTGRLLSAFDDLLVAPGAKSEDASVVLASELHFFHGADPKWTETSLLPLFMAPEVCDRMKLAWTGFLEGARPADTLVARLLPGYLAAAETDAFGSERLRPRLAYHLAWIAMFSSADPIEWLQRFQRSPLAIRVLWARNVARLLSKLDMATADEEWSRWIGVYWTRRVTTAAVPIDEASAMAEWVSYLVNHRREAITLATQCPGNIELSGNLLYQLTQIDLSDCPADWITFLDHLLRGASHLTNWMFLREVVQKLSTVTPRPDVGPLVQEALRLGIDEARHWSDTNH